METAEKKTSLQLLEEARGSDPAIDHQLPAPYVIDAIDDVVNLSAPFILEMPAINSDAYSDVLLVFVNADGSLRPQAVVHKQATSGVPTNGEVDNKKLSPPFSGDEYAVVQCFIRMRQTDVWQRTPDSVTYGF